MAKGENIFRRRDGRWEARYIKGRELSGKIRYGYCYGKTYREAKEKAEACKAAQANAAGDAVLLALVRLMTMCLSLVTTRILSTYLSTFAYGTYSQVLLIVSTTVSLTSFGLIDAINFYYCGTTDPERRESYVATILTLQCCIGAFAGLLIMLLTWPICKYFGNPELRQYLAFAAILPLLQNGVSILQVLFVSVGKARQLAIRNLVISLAQLACAITAGMYLKRIELILAVSVLLNGGQILFFSWSLKRSGCRIRLASCDFKHTTAILKYSIPMAVFTLVNAINRDMDKYLISAMLDTETLAIYSNAAKVLPFDILLISFMTVLLPHITRQIADKQYAKAVETYRAYLEISYISTALLAFSVFSAAPQAIELLYSEKYLSGLPVFRIYIISDIFHFASITLILTASGRTKLLMRLGFIGLGANLVLNILLYRLLGIAGPALATLLVSLGLGIAILHYSAKELNASIRELFDCTFLLRFAAECIGGVLLFSNIQRLLYSGGMHYLWVLILTAGSYLLCVGLPNLKRFLGNLKRIAALKPVQEDWGSGASKRDG